jgi:prepilin-type N-terminal cleavage/methylation domain-containing protein
MCQSSQTARARTPPSVRLSHARRVPPRGGRAFTVLELLVVVAILAVFSALAAPFVRGMQEDQRVRDSARQLASSFATARSRALASSRNHIVYFADASGVATDVCGNPITDPAGNAVPVIVLDDGPPGTGDCCFDPSATVLTVPARPGVSFGVSFAAAPPPEDVGAAGAGGMTAQGSTFATMAGVPTSGVLFRPDGVPATFDAACSVGGLGSGGGGVYVTNENRDYAVVLSPLGVAKVRRFERGSGTWQ